MSAVVLKPVAVISKPERAEPFTCDGWLIRIPIGAEPAYFACDQGGTLGCMVLMAPNAVVVDHPLILIRAGESYTPMLGRPVGKHLGSLMIPGLGQTSIFQDLPWPTRVLAS
jgi:hypothetical protein